MNPVVIVPAYRDIEPECEAGLRGLERQGIPVWRRFGCPHIDKARSALANEALARGFDRLLWIDADIAFRAQDARALLAAEHAFCCGAYVTKRPLGAFVLRVESSGELTFGEGGGWIEVLACGFGFVATSVEVFHAMEPLVPLMLDDAGAMHRPYFWPMSVQSDAGMQYLAEDFSFCHRARTAGFELWCDTRIRLFHIGRYLFSWEDTALTVPRSASVLLGSSPGSGTT